MRWILYVLVLSCLAGCTRWQSFAETNAEWATKRTLLTCECAYSKDGLKKVLWCTGGVTFAECAAFCDAPAVQ